MALVATIILISLLYFLLESQTTFYQARKSDHLGRCLQRARWALLMVPLLVLLTRTGTIDLIDAAFTAVSAVCVTGLIVLDTPYDFTGAGQFFIVLLIQLGGLGIMGIATVAFYAMGRRLSLRQERLMSSITDTQHSDLLQSLATILKFTFLVEGPVLNRAEEIRRYVRSATTRGKPP